MLERREKVTCRGRRLVSHDRAESFEKMIECEVAIAFISCGQTLVSAKTIAQQYFGLIVWTHE